MIDDCCALVRHITTVSSAQTVKDLKDKISCAIPAHERHHSRRDIVPAATYAATTAQVIDHVIADFLEPPTPVIEHVAHAPAVIKHVSFCT